MTSIYTINFQKNTIQGAGYLPSIIVETFKLTCTSCEVKIHPGAIKHIQKRHPGILERYGDQIPDMISNPEYIGHHPNVPYSIEIINQPDQYVLLAVKLDQSGYLFISSLYHLNNGPYKVQERVRNGRFIPYNQL